MHCPQKVALTVPYCHQYYSNRMDAVLDPMTDINRNDPVERPCLVKKMQGPTSMLVYNWMAMGHQLITPYLSYSFIKLVNGIH